MDISVRLQMFCVYSAGTTLAYLFTTLGLDQRMGFVDRNRTYRRNRDFLTSVTLGPSDTQ